MKRLPWTRLVAMAVGLSPAALLLASPISWNHDPGSPGGAASWGRLTHPFATCGAVFEDGSPFVEVGLRQSPIDIDTDDAIPASLPRLRFRYRPFHAEVEIVMQEPVVVSQEAVDTMMAVNAASHESAYPFNHRPVRPLNARKVLVNAGE